MDKSKIKLEHHGAQDYQSLLMHQEAVRMVCDNPALIHRLLETLQRWDRQLDRSSKNLRDQWVVIINNRDWDKAIEDSELGNQLRQASPMATLLPNKVRFDIIRKIRSLKDAA